MLLNYQVWPSGTSTTLPKQPLREALMLEGENLQEGEGEEEEDGQEQDEGQEQEEGVVITISDQQQELVKEDPESDSGKEGGGEVSMLAVSFLLLVCVSLSLSVSGISQNLEFITEMRILAEMKIENCGTKYKGIKSTSILFFYEN